MTSGPEERFVPFPQIPSEKLCLNSLDCSNDVFENEKIDISNGVGLRRISCRQVQRTLLHQYDYVNFELSAKHTVVQPPLNQVLQTLIAVAWTNPSIFMEMRSYIGHLVEVMRLISVPWALTFGSMFVMLTILGLLGNFVVIAAIAGDKKMLHSVMNLLLFNLAVADALNLVTTIVDWLPIVLIGRPGWILPSLLCPLTRYLEIIFLFVSIMTQLIVCIERYIAIAFPIHARRLCSRKNIVCTVIFTWIFVAFFALPYALLHQANPKSRSCQNGHASTQFWRSYKWTEFLSFYLFPCIIFVILYSRVSRILWVKNKLLAEISNSEAEIRARAEALKTRRNVVKMLVACVSIYFICYSPIQAIFLSKALFGIQLIPPYQVILLINLLAIMCSVCNPLLYTLFSKKFRSRIAHLLQCVGFEIRSNSTPTTVKGTISDIGSTKRTCKTKNGMVKPDSLPWDRKFSMGPYNSYVMIV